jgi:hypothetical protein
MRLPCRAGISVNDQRTRLLTDVADEHARMRATERRPAIGLAVALVCLAAASAIVARYPLAPWLMGAGLAAYAAALWRWPSIWLIAIPAALPAFNLALWTGWLYIGESDLIILVTVGVLALRAPPKVEDCLVRGLAGVTIAAMVAVYLVATVVGMALPTGPEGGSDLVHLRPDNALRLAKGFFLALALLPFLRRRRRTHGDALVLFALGTLAGMALVATQVFIERMLFVYPFDFDVFYRVVGPFFSMHLGGGHIGAYLVMAIPFLVVCLRGPNPLVVLCMLGLAMGAAYGVVVTYARAAYFAAFVAAAVASLGWSVGGRAKLGLALLVLLVIGGGVVAAATDSGMMSYRLDLLRRDAAVRIENWADGLALGAHDTLHRLIGMGLGTYPRIAYVHDDEDAIPSNFVLRREGGRSFLSLTAGTSLYIEQKVPLVRDQRYELSLSARSPDGRARISTVICEKVLLYSVRCNNTYRSFQPRAAGVWEDFTVALSSANFDHYRILRVIRRPVGLSLFNEDPGTTVEVTNVRLRDAQGRDIVENGDFRRGMTRWYFSDDNHIVWRIHNQYLMTLFESGFIGLAAFLVFVAAAMAGAVRAILDGEAAMAAVLGALTGFLCSSVFDYVLEAPRLATLFYLIAFFGLDALGRRSGTARLRGGIESPI